MRRRPGKVRQAGVSPQAAALRHRVEAQLAPIAAAIPAVSWARPLGECRRSRVPFQEGHMASSGSQLKQAPLPLQCIASSKPARTSAGMVRSNWPFIGTPSMVGELAVAGRGDLAGIELIARVERRLDRLQGRIERPEELAARTPSARPCRARPRAGRHNAASAPTTSSVTARISFSWAGSLMSMAGRTCSTPASTWPNMP